MYLSTRPCPRLVHNALLSWRMLCIWALALSLAGCGGGGGGAAAGGESSSVQATPAAVTATAQTSGIAVASRVNTDSAAKSLTLTVRAWGSLAANVGPMMEVRVEGVVISRIEVRAATPTDYTLNAPTLAPGAKVDVAFVNDEVVNGEDRNLFVAHISSGTTFIVPNEAGVVLDGGRGAAAYDGQNTMPGQEAMWGPGALRLTWPAANRFAAGPRAHDSARFLQHATFGATADEVARLGQRTFEEWIAEQMALPRQDDFFVSFIQSKYDRGTAYQPFGSKYDPDWVGQRFWAGAAMGQDQLRQRMTFALHKIFVTSQAEANLYQQARAYAAYLDTLNRHAFGNFRTLIEEVALSPAMAIYLSHIRNLKEDPATNRLPDENFARELMQLFTIGLHELNPDGSAKLNAQGKPIETYGNADVMALAKVFTGWSWGYDDAQLTEFNFRWGTPDVKTTGTGRVDIRRMKAYPGLASTSEKRLFAGKPNALVVPANTLPAESVRMALDTLFNHPNVGPFIGRQLIQQFVTSNPTPAYVARVAQTFSDNGRGVRGDLGAVLRAVLLDPEARTAPTSNSFGKLREPILRVTHWMRAFGASSASGMYQVTQDMAGLGQRPNQMPSVFSFFRPGYAPQGGALALGGLGSPEMQIIDESSIATWVNAMELMLREGMGWHGGNRDVIAVLHDEAALVATSPAALAERLNLLLFDGRMSQVMRKSLMDAMQGVPDWDAHRNTKRARVAIFVAMTSPEYLVQR